MRTAIVWFRRDLRLADNPALLAAAEEAERLIPVYIWAPEEDAPWAPGAASRWWLHHSLAALDAALRGRGSRLVIRAGGSLPVLRRLIADSGARAVYWNRLYEPASAARDRAAAAALEADGVHVAHYNAALLVEPCAVRSKSGGAYRVFTPFARAARAQIGEAPAPPAAAPARIAPHDLPPGELQDLRLLPGLPWADGFVGRWTPGEAGAARRLRRFAGPAIRDYREARDRPGRDGTSSLSPHLHFGELGARQVWAALSAAQHEHLERGVLAGSEAFARELLWREFGHQLLHHFPHTVDAPLNPRFSAFPWRRPEDYRDDLRRWQRGRTGVPMVDAGMRELWSTGWMHNRVRMIVGSYLVKNLLIPWQEGARWFWDTLVDADLANNTLGWQWIAGCGADASPYFRIFNPVTQARKFDPAGDYLRRWLPELAGASGDALYAPWAAPLPPPAYPAPSLVPAAARRRALEAFAALRGRTAAGKHDEDHDEGG